MPEKTKTGCGSLPAMERPLDTRSGRSPLRWACSAATTSEVVSPVGPAIPERVDPHDGGHVAVGHRLERARQSQAPLVEWNPGIRRLQVRLRRNLTVLQTKAALDDAGNTCRGLEVADVGLDRP